MTERLSNPSRVLPNGIRVQVPSEALTPRGYPEQPDDGTWEGEGGYVARRKPTAFVIESPPEFAPWARAPERLLVVDAETWAELRLAIPEASCPAR
jgi:hypothetical protein